MKGQIEGLLNSIEKPAAKGVFHVKKVPGDVTCFIGRDENGAAAILIKALSGGRSVPLKLAGIEALFGVDCRFSEPGGPESIDSFVTIVCTSDEVGIEAYFAGAMEILIRELPSQPSTSDVADCVRQLIELFQMLKNPPRQTVVGLIGELCFICAARSTLAAVSAWRVDRGGRFDFVSGALRIDVKASSSRLRVHDLSFDQANPPPETIGCFASIFIEAVGGGTSVKELVGIIESKLLGHVAAQIKLQSIIADTLGMSLLNALEFRFDLELAIESLRIYDAMSIPAVRGATQAGVSGIRFVSSFETSMPVDFEKWNLSKPSELMLFPNGHH